MNCNPFYSSSAVSILKFPVQKQFVSFKLLDWDTTSSFLSKQTDWWNLVSDWRLAVEFEEIKRKGVMGEKSLLLYPNPYYYNWWEMDNWTVKYCFYLSLIFSEMSGIEGEVGLVAGRSQREKKRSYKDLLREEEEIAAQVCKTSKGNSEVTAGS